MMQFSMQRPLGIMAALPEELGDVLKLMYAQSNVQERILGRRTYYLGAILGVPCVLTLARIGKVAAATTVSTLLHLFDAQAVVFIGVAGAVAKEVQVGDVVIAETLLQHDLNAAPLFPTYEVPLLSRTYFFTNQFLREQLFLASQAFLKEMQIVCSARFSIENMQLRQGLIISGDRFVSTQAEISGLRELHPFALAVEMEGAAVAQVCFEHDIPCAVLRTISDKADQHATESFSSFLGELATFYSTNILKNFFKQLEQYC